MISSNSINISAQRLPNIFGKGQLWPLPKKQVVKLCVRFNHPDTTISIHDDAFYTSELGMT